VIDDNARWLTSNKSKEIKEKERKKERRTTCLDI
jgi:predicted nucleic acid-binding Zn ribbon protein